jgi:hypothetical protein
MEFNDTRKVIIIGNGFDLVRFVMQNLFLSKRTATFADRNIHFSAYDYAGEIRDNTPSRLAVMQHTWGVFSY